MNLVKRLTVKNRLPKRVNICSARFLVRVLVEELFARNDMFLFEHVILFAKQKNASVCNTDRNRKKSEFYWECVGRKKPLAIM